MTTKNTLAHGIENAQVKLHETVRAALDEFTEETGMTVNGIKWSVSTASDENGHTHAVCYYSLRSDLSTGIS